MAHMSYYIYIYILYVIYIYMYIYVYIYVYIGTQGLYYGHFLAHRGISLSTGTILHKHHINKGSIIVHRGYSMAHIG